jgi:hypothetical protein
VLRRGAGRDAILIVARLRGRGVVTVDALTTGDWQVLLNTEDDPFAIDPLPPRVDLTTGLIEFQRPGAIIFASPGT